MKSEKEMKTYFTKVTRMVFIHQDSVMMLTTCITTTTWMASVLSDTTMTSELMSSLLSVVM